MTLYCHTTDCPNREGIEVAWVGQTDTDPGYLSTEVCPICRKDLEDDRLPDEEDDE